jgi:ribosome-binding protein aMBF1 (putative translation factor)
MPTVQFLPSIRDSETVTCRRCNMRQYPRRECARCHSALGVKYLSLPMDALLPPHTDSTRQLAHHIGDVLRRLRKRRGICQSQLARMALGIDRSYLSRAECGRVLLPLTKLLPLLQALGLTEVILRFDETGRVQLSKSNSRRSP